MLGVGLAAGFAGGAAVVTQYDDGRGVWSAALNRVWPELPRVEVQPPPDWLVAAQPGYDPGPLAASDPSRTIEVDAGTPAPEPLVAGQLTSGKAVETISNSPLAALYVQSHPAGAEVYLDGQLITTTPFQLSDVTPGQHTVRIELEGHRSWFTSVDLEAGTRIDITAALEE